VDIVGSTRRLDNFAADNAMTQRKVGLKLAGSRAGISPCPPGS
jgi:hypothetical protein